jgi:hypothetical protein
MAGLEHAGRPRRREVARAQPSEPEGFVSTRRGGRAATVSRSHTAVTDVDTVTNRAAARTRLAPLSPTLSGAPAHAGLPPPPPVRIGFLGGRARAGDAHPPSESRRPIPPPDSPAGFSRRILPPDSPAGFSRRIPPPDSPARCPIAQSGPSARWAPVRRSPAGERRGALKVRRFLGPSHRRLRTQSDTSDHD